MDKTSWTFNSYLKDHVEGWEGADELGTLLLHGGVGEQRLQTVLDQRLLQHKINIIYCKIKFVDFTYFEFRGISYL